MVIVQQRQLTPPAALCPPPAAISHVPHLKSLPQRSESRDLAWVNQSKAAQFPVCSTGQPRLRGARTLFYSFPPHTESCKHSENTPVLNVISPRRSCLPFNRTLWKKKCDNSQWIGNTYPLQSRLPGGNTTNVKLYRTEKRHLCFRLDESKRCHPSLLSVSAVVITWGEQQWHCLHSYQSYSVPASLSATAVSASACDRANQSRSDRYIHYYPQRDKYSFFSRWFHHPSWRITRSPHLKKNTW